MWIFKYLNAPLIDLECILKVLVILDKIIPNIRSNPVAPENNDIQYSFREFFAFDLLMYAIF